MGFGANDRGAMPPPPPPDADLHPSLISGLRSESTVTAQAARRTKDEMSALDRAFPTWAEDISSGKRDAGDFNKPYDPHFRKLVGNAAEAIKAEDRVRRRSGYKRGEN